MSDKTFPKCIGIPFNSSHILHLLKVKKKLSSYEYYLAQLDLDWVSQYYFYKKSLVNLKIKRVYKQYQKLQKVKKKKYETKEY